MEHQRYWRTIECALVENNNGSRVITTTRHQDIATTCCFPGQGHVYLMQPLDEHHSRRLFFKRLFNTEDGCPEQFRDISNDVLRKCKGVPLAITSIASLLANPSSKHVETWEKIRNSLGYELDSNPTLEWMRHVLSLSYSDLSQELKTCLLYLGNYPEDYEIGTFDLMRKWIAEGFVREKHGLDLEEAAENCLNELINRSMVTPIFFPNSGEMWRCRVHDLMLDLIVSKCKEENFVTIIDTEFLMNRASQVRRISHQYNSSDMALAVESMNPSLVRSYNSFRAANCVPPLSKFELLRVLDMHQGSSIMESGSKCLDLSAINHLFLLRYVKVSGFHLELPKKFGKVEHLMTLDMSHAWFYPSSSNQLSSDFSSLSSLRHLEFPAKKRTLTLINGLSKLSNLRTLLYFHVEANSVECITDLGELTNLRELYLTYSRSGNAEDNPDTILAASLHKLGNNNLRYLDLDYQGVASAQFRRNWFTCPRHLQRLGLYGLIPKVPTWIAHADRLSYLYNLEVQELQTDDFHVLARLPCLIYLCLRAKTIPGINIIIYPNTFPNLKYFVFYYCELPCQTFEPAPMPRLQKLEIQFDGREQAVILPSGFVKKKKKKKGAIQLQEGSIVGGIRHLACLEKVSVDIHAEFGHGSIIETAWREAINKHPKSQAIQIRVQCTEYDENGNKLSA
ncbi:hypothetical protein U9M48_041651 [Paspalum notatum var. saurae]|uniref:NB-ARC domain-containing protein n=1 Tax=Paspalum notatum var. saurae TaxID=547442 RepID=A0AAQ3XFI1_PASNO